MGSIIFESNPTIFGSDKSFSKKEQNYFNRVNNLLKVNYEKNLYSMENLEASLEQKYFNNNKQLKQNQIEEDISWIDYIYEHLDFIIANHNNIQWASELKALLSREVFVYENNFCSNFFYNEYSFNTCPEVISNSKKEINNNIMERQPLLDINGIKEGNNGYNELDITDNLGGSYLEVKMDNLDPNDPTVQYHMNRKKLKSYIHIFKDHIYNNKNHPINRVVFLFVNSFCKYINQNIKNFNNQLKNQLLVGDNYENNVKNFEEEITSYLQDFINVIHTSLKLFYSTCINYSCFKEEKDDLINLVTCLFFKTGKLYESIYSLYLMSYNQDTELLQEKLNDLKNVKPKDLGVQIKFCLDEDTLELQRSILKEKKKEKEDKINTKENNFKKESELYQIKETEDEKENEDDNDKSSKNNCIINTTKEPDNKINSFKDEEDDYLLAKINEDFSVDFKMDALSGGFLHLRNTINSFNNKKYLFPKIRENIRDTLTLNDQYIKEAKASGKLPVPYYSAINLLKNIKNYKTPFEKIVILAALSDQVMESVSTFWSSMQNYVKNTFLNIEADEIMSIFVFIVIRAQMPELFIESKIISNFTTPSTRAFNIAYNLTLMEASLETITKMENSKELSNKENQLKEVRKSIAILTTQRLSRLSRASVPENIFS
jgi:hypothetical protein